MSKRNREESDEDNCELSEDKLLEFLPEEPLDLRPYMASEEEQNLQGERYKKMLEKCAEVDPPYFGENGPFLPPGKCKVIKSTTDPNNYTKTRYKNKEYQSHRLTWMIKNKLSYIPKTNANGEKILIRHLCNNKKCIFMDHLRAGTSASNSDDALITGTYKIGEKRTNSYISNEIVNEIRASLFPRNHQNYTTIQQRAKKFGVTWSVVQNIDVGKTYAQVPLPNGNLLSQVKIINTRKLERARKRINKEKVWADEDWKNASDYLKSKSLETDKVFENYPCVEWQGSILKKGGYGKAFVNGINIPAHFLSLVLYNGKQPPKPGEMVCHKCHNRKCVQPRHLYYGTMLENGDDSSKDGRYAKILTPELVIEIRLLFYKEKKTIEEIMQLCNIQSIQVIRKVCHFKSWEHTTTPEIELYYFKHWEGGRSKIVGLSNDEVRHIRQEYENDQTKQTIENMSNKYRVTTAHITRIARRQTLKEVPDTKPKYVDPRIEYREKKEKKAEKDNRIIQLLFGGI